MEIIHAEPRRDVRDEDRLKVALAQIEPIWLDRAKTLERVTDAIEKAGAEGVGLCVFGEALVPGYPFWVA
ncbi:MAG: nitrilase-related carbon-nitrogen hydrolase, partial [Pseudomonadota bacterium]